MKIITVTRKSGKIIIEAPDDAEIIDLLAEHEITSYESLKLNYQENDLKNATSIRLPGEAADRENELLQNH